MISFWLFRASLYLACLAVIGLGVLVFMIVRQKSRLLRLPLQIGSIALIVPGSLTLLAFGCFALMTKEIVSPPINARDSRFAVRVVDTNSGVAASDTSVFLYSGVGLSSEMVFSGEWKTVEPKDIHWVDNRTLLIDWHGPYPPIICKGARGITVRCERALEPVH